MSSVIARTLWDNYNNHKRIRTIQHLSSFNQLFIRSALMVDTQKFAGNLPDQPSGDSTLQPGSVLQGRYRITGVIGVGGMGSVYQARDLRFPNVTRYVAVKEMLNLSTDQSMREMTLKTFERESDMLASLSHPAVPEIYDYFPSKDSRLSRDGIYQRARPGSHHQFHHRFSAGRNRAEMGDRFVRCVGISPPARNQNRSFSAM